MDTRKRSRDKASRKPMNSRKRSREESVCSHLNIVKVFLRGLKREWNAKEGHVYLISKVPMPINTLGYRESGITKTYSKSETKEGTLTNLVTSERLEAKDSVASHVTSDQQEALFKSALKTHGD